MKNKSLLPLIVVFSVTLLSFTPDADNGSLDTSVITCNDGTVIIPSGVNMSRSDQEAMVRIMSAYGSDAGYFVYETDGAKRVYNAVPGNVLSSADGTYGSDLSSGTVGTGWAIYKETICLTMAKHILYKTSVTTTSLHDELAPILAKYGYEDL